MKEVEDMAIVHLVHKLVKLLGCSEGSANVYIDVNRVELVGKVKDQDGVRLCITMYCGTLFWLYYPNTSPHINYADSLVETIALLKHAYIMVGKGVMT